MRYLFLLITLLFTSPTTAATLMWMDDFESYPTLQVTYPWASTGTSFVAQIENYSSYSGSNSVGTSFGWAGSGIYRVFPSTITAGYVDVWLNYCGWNVCSQIYGPDAGSKVLVAAVSNPYTVSPSISGVAGVVTVQGTNDSVGTMQIIDKNGIHRGSPVEFPLNTWVHLIMTYNLSLSSSGSISFTINGNGSSYNGPTSTGAVIPVNGVVLQFQSYGCCCFPQFTVAYDDISVWGGLPDMATPTQTPVGQIFGFHKRNDNIYSRITPCSSVVNISNSMYRQNPSIGRSVQ